MQIAILETEKKLAAERQIEISSITALWEAKLQNLQVNPVAPSLSSIAQVETPSKRKSIEVEEITQMHSSPTAKRVRINNAETGVSKDTHEILEDEIPEDGEEFNMDSSQADLDPGAEPVVEEFENGEAQDDFDEKADTNESDEMEDFAGEEDTNALINDGSVESVKSADLSKDEYVYAPETPAAALDTSVDDDFVGTPEATAPEPILEEPKPAPVAEIAVSAKEAEPIKLDIVAPKSEIVLPTRTPISIKPPPEMHSVNKPVSIQRPAASPSTPATKLSSKSPSVETPSQKKETTLKKVTPETEAPSKSTDTEAAALKQQKTLLLQKKLEALRAGAAEGDKPNPQKPRIIRNPPIQTTGTSPARGSGRGRATISIRGSRGRGNPQPPK